MPKRCCLVHCMLATAPFINWLVVWSIWIICFHNILGMSSSQLTNSIIFQRGRYTTTTAPFKKSPKQLASSQDLPPTTAGIAAAAGYADGAHVNGRAAPLAPVTIGAAEPREEAARRGGCRFQRRSSRVFLRVSYP